MLFCVSIPMATVLVDVTLRVVSSLVVDGEDEHGLFTSRGAADGLTPLFRFGQAHRAFQ